MGIRPVAISVDAPEVTREHRHKSGYTFMFLSDQNREVTRRYNLEHKGAGVHGEEIARPAEFLVDRSGTVRWRNLTEDFRIRTRAEEMLEAARAMRN